MLSRALALFAALGLFAALPIGSALADETPADRPNDQPAGGSDADRPADSPKKDPSDRPADAGTKPEASKAAAPTETTLRFENDTRFTVRHDVSTGALVFRAADPSVRLTQPPVVVVSGREVPLVAAEPGVWRVTHESFRVATFPQTQVRIVADGRTYTQPLVFTSAGPVRTAGVARFGGHLVRLTECNAHVEVVRDPATGALTIHPVGDLQLVEAPVITVTESKGPTTVTLTRVEGQTGVWRATHPSFRVAVRATTETPGVAVPAAPGTAPVAVAMPPARIRVMVAGRVCEAPLVLPHRANAQMVTVEGGPRFEVVPDPANRTYTFYAVDESIEGRAYTIENPQVVVATSEGTRTYTLAPVPNEPRAWRMVGLDAGVREPLDGTLRFTLFGKSLETQLGLSGLHVGVR